jgi:hypothetical protein
MLNLKKLKKTDKNIGIKTELEFVEILILYKMIYSIRHTIF